MLFHWRATILAWAALAATAAAAMADAPATPAAGPTNFVVLLCDDLGYGDLGCFGHPRIRTPALDRLASEGLKLTACYSSSPVCSPSRSGLLTGRTPNRLGVYDWIPEGSPMHLKRPETTIAALLKKAGYDTCHSGKWHCNGKFNLPDQPQPADHGFDHSFGTQNNAAPSHENPVNFVRNGCEVGPLQGYSSHLVVEEAMRWLDARAHPARPFFLYVCFHEPHEPIASAAEYVKLYPNAENANQGQHHANITQMDAAVGKLLAHLDRKGLSQNTLVYFSSDNGPETLKRYNAASRSYGSPGVLKGMKLWLYEGGIRVPGIIRWPGKARPGTVCDEPVAALDILPTFCQIAGIAAPADRPLDGASFLPIFAGQPIARRQPLYWQYDRAVGWAKVALRDGDWKLLADAELAKFELYRIKDDVGEQRELAAAEPARTAAMTAAMKRIHAAVKSESPTWPDWTPPGRKKPRARPPAAKAVR